MRRFAAALIVALVASAAHAQEPRAFCADRPGKATPPCILDQGRVQLEVGLADAVFERSGGAHEDAYALGAAELRFGLTRRVEAEIGWTPLIIDRVRGAGTTRGTGDLTFAARAALTDPDGEGAAVSIQGFVNAPTATHGLGAGGWTGGARLPVSIPLGGSLGLGLAPEVDVVRDADGHGAHLSWSTAAGLSRGFGRLSLGAELWGQVDDDPAGREYQASADLMAAWAIGEDAQLDAGVNVGLTHATPDVEIYAGVARRF